MLELFYFAVKAEVEGWMKICNHAICESKQLHAYFEGKHAAFLWSSRFQFDS